MDTTLNGVWALLCISAVLCHWRWDRRHPAAYARRVRWHRYLCVFLAAVSLFPCISASDDRVRLRDLDKLGHLNEAVASGQDNDFQLIAQLQDIEHGRITTPLVLAPAFSSVLLGQPEQPSLVRAVHLDSSSRAPPTL